MAHYSLKLGSLYLRQDLNNSDSVSEKQSISDRLSYKKQKLVGRGDWPVALLL
jgi:hypothetical protein